MVVIQALAVLGGQGCLIMYTRVPVALATSLLCIERSVADPSDADDTTGIF